MKRLTKSHYDAIASAFAEQARPMKAVLKMARSTENERNEQRMVCELQVLWNTALAIRDRLLYTPGFDEHKFLDATGCSPQEWRFHKWVDRNTYASTYDPQAVLKD